MILNPAKLIKQTVQFNSAISASANGAAVDKLGWRTARISPIVGVVADTASFTLTLEDSADNSSWAAVASGPSVAIAGTDDNTAKTPIDINLDNVRRYIRPVLTYAGSSTGTVTLVIQLMQPISVAQATDTASEFFFG